MPKKSKDFPRKISEIKCRRDLKKVLESSELISTSSSLIDSSLLFELQKKKDYREVHLDMNPFKKILYDFYVRKKVFKNHGEKFVIEPRYSFNSERYYIAKEV